MRHLIVGTAGHVDHGKTRLVEALTGIDCDRWAEEKERGITIDLGFAHLESEEFQLGFVDVPGHQRFLHNALAGLGGIGIMLLVVAADEGVEPQTREHLDICSLLEIPAAVAVITKADLVDRELLELARLEVEDLLAATPFAGSRVLTASSLTGAGIEELRGELLALAERHSTPLDPDRPTRLPVDRAFHLQGRGVVATGTLVSGQVQSGQTLELSPASGGARVRSVQVHGTAREVAEAGERTALQLSGIELPAVARGVQLVTPGSAAPTTSLAARVELLPSAPAEIRGWTAVRFHLFAAEVLGRLRPLAGPLGPGRTGEVEIRLRAAVDARRGDRFIIRRPSPATTLGGGEILDPRWLRRRGRSLEKALSALASGLNETILLWAEESGEAGLAGEDLARRLGVKPNVAAAALHELAGEQRLLELRAQPQRWITPSIYQRIVHRAESTLKEYFRRNRLAGAIPKAEAVSRILSSRGAQMADTYFAWLQAQGILTLEGGRVSLPGRTAKLSGEESQLETAVVGRYAAAGLQPPSPSEVQRELGAKPQILEGLIRYLVERRRLVRLPDGLIVSAEALVRLRQELLESGWDRFSVPEFKERFGLTRKWAIPYLEHLDSIGATRRLGSERQVVRPEGDERPT